ncbi:MAG TPA: VOC family protein [Stellaceae bacterium]|nr:VOC family protein [Stellaceae bacterium]
MAKISVNGVRSVDLGVTDLKAAAKFYTEIWGLRPVAERAGSVYLRGTGPSHHIVALHARPKGELLRVDLTAPDKAAVEAIHAQVREAGSKDVEKPAPIGEPGGGYGFAFRDPEGRTIRILAEAKIHGDTKDDPDRPRKISHVVLCSMKPAATVDFFGNALGFKVSDRTAMMTFIRCNTDHHSLAFVQAEHVTLHHIAFEMENLEAVMRGGGRLKDRGYPIEWGVGRHGPGDNVFAYFLGPNDMVIEYTAEVEQVDDSYRTGGPEDWKWPPGRIDHWGIAVGPSDRMRAAHERVAFPPEIFHPAA